MDKASLAASVGRLELDERTVRNERQRSEGRKVQKAASIAKQAPECSESENDKEAILLRAHGKGSDILVDREMEMTTQELLAEKGLAAPLLARFKNGRTAVQILTSPLTKTD